MIKSDVLVVGAGAAGLLLALHAAARGLDVVLATKGTLQESNTAWAQGGVAAALNLEDDSPAAHAADTIAAGAGLVNDAAAELVAREAPQRVEELQSLGVAFTIDLHGGLALTREAAHSHARVAFAADHTGQAIATTLADKVGAHPNITVVERACAVELAGGPEGCRGAWLIADNRLLGVAAGATALATGGSGQLFSRTTNPPGATADGLALALAAGAKLADLEFVQFHPTALAVAGAPALLISEAARGEGAIVVDGAGERFLFQTDARGELAPRDIVARAIFRKLQSGGVAFLDLRPVGTPDVIRTRFPNIAAACSRFGIDIATAPIPIAPAAHYHMGGVATDLWGRTSVPRLYAIGECACTGLHGANRLASNSLAECLVFAARAADDIESILHDEFSGAPFSSPPAFLEAPGDVAHLQAAMWRSAGIEREAAGLQSLLASIAAEGLDRQLIGRPALEARALWQASQYVARSALIREESRGSHYRTDFPERDDAHWLVHIIWDRAGSAIAPLPVPR
ncbi:MAG TPA: L-aspartate oxidase [Candidatus Binatus sp.]|nr:L-aspartate oxidase [Candidatus Binatus sp.]